MSRSQDPRSARGTKSPWLSLFVALSLSAVLVLLCLAVRPATANAVQTTDDPCPNGFHWERMSGTGCVQNYNEWPPFGHAGYTGSPVCDIGAAITDWRESKAPVPGTPAVAFPYLCLCDTYDPAIGDDPEPSAATKKNCGNLAALIIESRFIRDLPAPDWADAGPMVTLPPDNADDDESPPETEPTVPEASDDAEEDATSSDEPSKGKTALGAGVAALALTTLIQLVRDGHIRGKAADLVRKAEKAAKRGERRAAELLEKAQKAAAVALNPGVFLERAANRKIEKLRQTKRAKRFERRARELQEMAEPVIRDPGGALEQKAKREIEKLRQTKRGQQLERRAGEFSDKVRKAGDVLADPEGATKKKVKEYVKRLRDRARKRAADPRLKRRLKRLTDRINRRTKGILNAESTLRLARAMGDPRRFSREVRRNPALARYVISRAGLSPVAIEAIGGPKAVQRMLGRIARNPGREVRRAVRFAGRPKEWANEIGRAGRRVVRGFGRLFGVR